VRRRAPAQLAVHVEQHVQVAQLGGTVADGVVWASSPGLLASVDLGRNLIECSSIFCTPGATSPVLLQAADAHVHVKRIQFDSSRVEARADSTAQIPEEIGTKPDDRRMTAECTCIGNHPHPWPSSLPYHG